MVDLDEMAEEQERMLRELAELGMDFARDLKAQVKAIKSVPEADALALAFYRVSRGVRLTLALRAKLVREHLEIGKLQRTADQRATERRKAQIKAVLEDEIFTEDRDQDEADALQERLSERLDTEALFDRFLNGPVDRAIIRIRKDIGLPDEGGEADPDPPPQGEGNREVVEGVEAHSDLHSLQPPRSAALKAPPEEEQLETADLKPGPS